MVVRKRYKSNDDNRVRFDPKYAPGDYVFVDRHSLTTSAVECLAAEGYAKVMPKMDGLYCVKSVGSGY